MRLALIANIPYPYRNPVYDLIGERLGDNFLAIYSAPSEPNRAWDERRPAHNHVYLKGWYLPYGDEGFYHINTSIWKELNRFKPDTVILFGYGLTMQIAFAWSKLHKAKIILFNDGWEISEKRYSFRQRTIKRLIINHSDSFIASSQKAADLYRKYGASESKIIISHIPIDTKLFHPSTATPKIYDLIFVAQFIERKCPLFVADVINELSHEMNTKSLIIGDGKLLKPFLDRIEKPENIRLVRSAQYDEMPHYYRLSRILLFPTLEDIWGCVAGEALACGLPVITTGTAGCVGELVIDGQNGYVLPLQVSRWVKTIKHILDSRDYCEFCYYDYLSTSAVEIVSKFSIEAAAESILGACMGEE